MDIEEARKVTWLRNHPRPLGELLDSGYLDRSKLEWAAQKAFDPNLKEAAKVLLGTGASREVAPKSIGPTSSAQPAFESPVSLEKARATAWPFLPYKGQPMGPLVESKRLSLKDLGYAIENAWEPKVRQAAIALALVRLEQAIKEPVPSAGFVHMVSGGRSFAERRQSLLFALEGAVIGFLFGSALIILIALTINMFRPHPTFPNKTSLVEFISTPAGLAAIIIFLGLMVFVFWLSNFVPDLITKRLDKLIEEQRRGQEGEEKAVRVVLQALDGNWSIFRNISLPGRNIGDLDIVLVGPPGIWVLEVKNFRGQYRNIGEAWQYRQDKKWKTQSKSPSRQGFNNAIRLGNFLKADHLKVYVNAAVIWANEESPLSVENPSIPVWLYNQIPEELGNIWQVEKLTKEERGKISVKLSKLCEEQKNSN